MDKLLKTVESHDMLTPGDRVVVGVSGGPDSMALLHLLCRLRESYDLDLHAVHVHHGLRGPDAEADAACVEDVGKAWAVPTRVERVDVATLARQRRRSRQDTARQERYRIFRDVLSRLNGQRIAMGHHADDQVETITMRFLRGGGIKGLGGMPPVRDVIIRPLIEVSRPEVEAYCQAQGLTPRRDVSNQDPAYLRNRIREELLPLLEREYNPNIRVGLGRLGHILRDEDAYLEARARRAYIRCLVQPEPDRRPWQAPRAGDGPGGDTAAARGVREIRLHAERLSKEHPVMQRRIIRLAVAGVRGDLNRLEFQHVETVKALAQQPRTGGRVALPGPMEVYGEYGIMVFRPLPVPGPGWIERQLAIPGVTEVPELHILVYSAVEEAGSHPQHVGERGGKPAQGVEPVQHSLCVDLDRVQPPLFIRNRRPGDRLRIPGLGGTKKLQDLLVDEKVPRDQRDWMPVVVDQEGILWVVGVRAADQAQVSDGTQKYLHLVVERLYGSD